MCLAHKEKQRSSWCSFPAVSGARKPSFKAAVQDIQEARQHLNRASSTGLAGLTDDEQREKVLGMFSSTMWRTGTGTGLMKEQITEDHEGGPGTGRPLVPLFRCNYQHCAAMLVFCIASKGLWFPAVIELLTVCCTSTALVMLVIGCFCFDVSQLLLLCVLHSDYHVHWCCHVDHLLLRQCCQAAGDAVQGAVLLLLLPCYASAIWSLALKLQGGLLSRPMPRPFMASSCQAG